MPTLPELAQQYANEIASAASITQKASAEPEDLRTTVLSVISRVELLKWEGSEEKLASDDQTALLAQVDEALGVRRGTMVLVKKSSIQSTLAFETALAQLKQEIQSQAAKK